MTITITVFERSSDGGKGLALARPWAVCQSPLRPDSGFAVGARVTSRRPLCLIDSNLYVRRKNSPALTVM